MATGLLLDCDETVAKWQANLCQLPVCKYDRALGLLDNKGVIIGAVIFQNWNGCNVEMGYHGKQTLTAGITRCLARYILLNFDPSRLTVITSKRNRQLMRGLQRLGFRLEGTQRCYYGKRDCNRNTGVRFVMFRDVLEKIAKIPQEAQKCS